MTSDRPLSAFELAIPWLERARDELMKRDPPHLLTQMGLYLYPDSMDGFIRECLIFQGLYEWRRGRREEAKAWFRRAQRHVEEMLSKPYPYPIAGIFRDWAEMYKSYPEIVDLDARAEAGGPEEQRALVQALQDLLVKFDPIDGNLFWERNDPDAYLNARKRKLPGVRDEAECNDGILLAYDLAPGYAVQADLEPRGMDVDYFWIRVPAPKPADGPAPERPAKPVPVLIEFYRPEGAEGDLRITIFDRMNQPRHRTVLDGWKTERAKRVLFPAPEYGHYTLGIEPADPAAPWPADTRYLLQYSVGP